MALAGPLLFYGNRLEAVVERTQSESTQVQKKVKTHARKLSFYLIRPIETVNADADADEVF